MNIEDKWHWHEDKGETKKSEQQVCMRVALRQAAALMTAYSRFPCTIYAPHQHPRAPKHYPTTQQLPILIAPLHRAVKHKVVTIKPAKFTAS